MFNLLELLLVSTLIFVSSSSGIYLFTSPPKTCQQQADEVITLLSYARQQALFRGVTVTVEPLNKTPRDQASWSYGIQIATFADPLHPVVLRQHHWFQPSTRLRFKAYPQSKQFQFLANGMSEYQNGTWYYHSRIANKHCNFRIIISQAGRVHVLF